MPRCCASDEDAGTIAILKKMTAHGVFPRARGELTFVVARV
jgi:hypothetical protein